LQKIIMNQSLLEKFGLEKLLFFVIIIAVVIVFGVVFYLFFGYSSKNLELLTPIGRESWEIGQTYEIKWKSRGVDRVGIILFNEEKPEWIAENLSASGNSYKWKIPAGHEYGDNFWVAVIEYPWRSGNKVSYSKGSFSITYPELASCDSLSLQEEWPFFASDVPNVRKVFITKETFTGNLGGLAGADEKCQVAAAELGLKGSWTAFIGGEDPEDTAVKRLERTPRGLTGIFIDAESSSELLRGATCHRLLAKDFTELLKRITGLEIVNEGKLSSNFLKLMGAMWLGRIDENSKRTCLPIESAMYYLYAPLAEKYSYTVTCQNWNYENKLVAEYIRKMTLDDTFPSCYTPQGEFTYSVAAGGLTSSLKTFKDNEINDYFVLDIGKYCSEKQHILCIED